jgi:hypothetical protein
LTGNGERIDALNTTNTMCGINDKIALFELKFLDHAKKPLVIQRTELNLVAHHRDKTEATNKTETK